ncbi:MAG: Rieske (2Fe-2S) protein [Sandaracinaceae bacterium]|nr:Rieske (2Fe-2S) protein [Sandaracinaceae bacterium]
MDDRRTMSGDDKTLAPPTVTIAGGALLEERASRKFSIDDERDPREGFILRYAGELRAFENRCPHWQVDLDLGMGEPYLDDLQKIFCRNHAAIFDPLTGVCESGPCLGRSIRRYPIRIEGEDLIVTLEAMNEGDDLV